MFLRVSESRFTLSEALIANCVAVAMVTLMFHGNALAQSDSSVVPGGMGLGKSAVFELSPHTGIMSGSGLFGLKLAMNYGTLSLELSGEQVIGKYANTYPVFVGAIVNFATEARFIPYIMGGVGLLTTVPTTTIGDETVSSMGFNAGAGMRFYFTQTFGLRADFKQVMTNVKNKRQQKNELLSFQQVSLGVSILVR